MNRLATYQSVWEASAMIRFVVVDLELTHRDPEQAHIVEWAAVTWDTHWFGSGGIGPAVGSLVRPPIPIPPETSAVHHIIDADVAGAPSWAEEQQVVSNLLAGEDTIVVGHTVATERAMLASLQLPCRWLCTHKAALRVWPDAPAFSNEALRYYLGLGTGRSEPQAPHSAAHDARVTAQILQELLRVADPIDMIRWTDEPALLPRCPIGDYRGMKWSEIPDDSFLEWILRKIYDREDLRFCAQRELDRREEERHRGADDEPERTAAPAIGDDADDSDIPF